MLSPFFIFYPFQKAARGHAFLRDHARFLFVSNCYSAAQMPGDERGETSAQWRPHRNPVSFVHLHAKRDEAQRARVRATPESKIIDRMLYKTVETLDPISRCRFLPALGRPGVVADEVRWFGTVWVLDRRTTPSRGTR
jgi:hypothetical protein